MTGHPPISYPDRPLHHFLEDAADAAPERAAVSDDDRTLSFREVDQAANALAHALGAAGIGPGDRVAVALPTGIDLVVTLFAVSKAGAAAVLTNPRWTADEMRGALTTTTPRGLIAHEPLPLAPTALPPLLLHAGGRVATGWRPLVDAAAGQPRTRPAVPVAAWGPLEAVLPFSSGTTGLPKAAVHTHSTIVPATLQWVVAGAMRPSDRMLLFLPGFHVYGVITAAGAFAARAHLRLQERFDVAAVLDCIEQEAITLTFGAAPVALALDGVPDLEKRDLSSLRYVSWGATPMDVALARRVSHRSGIRWLHAYGATEAPLLFCNPAAAPPHTWRLDCPGLPVSDTQVRIVDLATREPCGPGEPGEVLVRGPQVFRGYLPPVPEQEVFEDGWLRTGDVGLLDESGALHLVERAKEMIKVNAFQVAPAELERLLMSHPAVADCGVFGVPDPRTGETPVAAVVLREDTAPEDLLAWVGERVATYKRITAVHRTATIPRTPSGKILRRELRAGWLADHAREGSR